MLMDMNPYKAPGPDIFQSLFYQKMWSTVGPEFSSVALDCLNIKILSPTLNETFLVLILKIANLETLKYFRPISLCNVLYKTITKAIVNRPKPLRPVYYWSVYSFTWLTARESFIALPLWPVFRASQAFD